VTDSDFLALMAAIWLAQALPKEVAAVVGAVFALAFLEGLLS